MRLERSCRSILRRCFSPNDNNNLVLLLCFILLVKECQSLSSTQLPADSRKFLILGGTGRIGTAVASHLLHKCPQSSVILAGRNALKGRNALAEVLEEHPSLHSCERVTFECLDWRDDESLKRLAQKVDCIIHTAGPFLSEKPSPLSAAIQSSCCKAYIDVADPLDFLDESLSLNDAAVATGTTALLAAGAFPGMSNVLAVEAAAHLFREQNQKVQDVRFNYFTAGLGGSGDVNLYITNLGFGEPMAQYEQGKLRMFKALSGLTLGEISFFLENDPDNKLSFGNQAAKERIGKQTVFSWPFPEAATVARELNATGDSSAAMGTAPHAWNVMLGILVSLIPRAWWRSERFSKFLADFSEPLVKATDQYLKIISPDKVGETHAMRVDITGEGGSSVSVVQAHESFRRCVAQSCAEFALDLLDNPSPGVRMPEQRYRSDKDRERIIKHLTSTPGTMAYTGPVVVTDAPPPSKMNEALDQANRAENSVLLQ